MDFNTFIDQAWADHATDAHGVAARLHDGLPLMQDEAQVTRWTSLAAHVWGEHLANWQAGIDGLRRVCSLPVFHADGTSGQAWRRAQASLVLAAGDADGADALNGMGPSDQIRVAAMAASHLVAHDVARAGRLLQDALAMARRSALPPGDATHRALAVTGNGMACALEEKPIRTTAERDLMVLAARTARHHWERAGTWLEVERAEYRLAHTWRKAGDLQQARSHAQACLDIVAQNGGAALEQLFGWEAVGLVEHAAGNTAGHARALARAQQAFDALADADKAWCAATISALAAPPAAQAVAGA